MNPQEAINVLAAATSALVEEPDVAETTAKLVDGCLAVLSVEACGILVADRNGGLYMLAASSHRSAELELYQSQIREGPCVDACSSNSTIVMTAADDFGALWPAFSAALINAGFSSAHASPLRWRGRAIGALNLFRVRPMGLSGEEAAVAQAVADMEDAHLTLKRRAEESGLSLTDAAQNVLVEAQR